MCSLNLNLSFAWTCLNPYLPFTSYFADWVPNKYWIWNLVLTQEKPIVQTTYKRPRSWYWISSFTTWVNHYEELQGPYYRFLEYKMNKFVALSLFTATLMTVILTNNIGTQAGNYCTGDWVVPYMKVLKFGFVIMILFYRRDFEASGPLFKCTRSGPQTVYWQLWEVRECNQETFGCSPKEKSSGITRPAQRDWKRTEFDSWHLYVWHYDRTQPHWNVVPSLKAICSHPCIRYNRNNVTKKMKKLNSITVRKRKNKTL